MTLKLDELLLNPKTLAASQLFINQPAHALMISGQLGSGKSAVARALASAALGVENIDIYPHFIVIRRPEDKQEIPIEDVRKVLHGLRLRTTGFASLRRIIFIEDAHYLSSEAQNALLKAIEEPASDTAFILSTHSEQAVLPTIASRAQRLPIQAVGLAQTQEYYANNYSPKEIESAWRLSQGAPGLLNALLTNESEHPLRVSVERAKELLRKQPYERLIELDKLSKDKEQLNLLLDALARVLNALQRVALDRNASQTTLLANRRLIANMRSKLQANASPKLIATTLALNLKA